MSCCKQKMDEIGRMVGVKMGETDLADPVKRDAQFSESPESPRAHVKEDWAALHEQDQ